jgi:hypothetical protein
MDDNVDLSGSKKLQLRRALINLVSVEAGRVGVDDFITMDRFVSKSTICTYQFTCFTNRYHNTFMSTFQLC